MGVCLTRVLSEIDETWGLTFDEQSFVFFVD